MPGVRARGLGDDNMKPYQKIAYMYDKDWGKFSSKYMSIISFVNESQEYSPSTFLDIACGTGKLLAELYAKGYQVVGLDLSSDMISIARSNNPDIEFIVGDMCSFNLDRRFDIITCAFDSLNYLLTDNQMRIALSNINSHLNDTGYFIFDINTPKLYEQYHFGVIDREYNGSNYKQILNYDRDNRIGKTVFDFGDGDCEEHLQKAYTNEEMKTFLNVCGFEIVESFKNFDRVARDENAYKVIYVTKKKS
jgi:SAM-dependent methyltransferase